MPNCPDPNMIFDDCSGNASNCVEVCIDGHPSITVKCKVDFFLNCLRSANEAARPNARVGQATLSMQKTLDASRWMSVDVVLVWFGRHVGHPALIIVVPFQKT